MVSILNACMPSLMLGCYWSHTRQPTTTNPKDPGIGRLFRSLLHREHMMEAGDSFVVHLLASA
jgi:hypothetical protein